MTQHVTLALLQLEHQPDHSLGANFRARIYHIMHVSPYQVFALGLVAIAGSAGAAATVDPALFEVDQGATCVRP